MRVDAGPHSGEELVVLGNHWPSRSGGQYETEPFRMMVAENASVIVESHLVKDEDTKIILMGDFNDEPFNSSIVEYLLAVRERELVTKEKPTGIRNRYSEGKHPFKPYVYNPTWTLMEQEDPGTFYYSGWNMLDQVMVPRALIEGGGLLLDPTSVKLHVDQRPNLVGGTVKKSDNKGAPRGFQKKKDGTYEGYSDHLPITAASG